VWFGGHYLLGLDLTVLVSSEDFSIIKSDSLYKAGGGILTIECVEMCRGSAIVDVDFMRGGCIEEITMDCEAGDREG
jgi:hypothetical protein